MEGKNQKKGNDSRLIAPQDPQERWDKGAAQRSDCTAGRGFFERLRNSDIALQAEQLRPGHRCTLNVPDDPSTVLAGGLNYHIPVDFEDGVQWLARVRIERWDSPPEWLERRLIASEFTTHRLLNKSGIRVPAVYWPQKQENKIYYFFVERIGGLGNYPPLTAKSPAPSPYVAMNPVVIPAFFNDLADFYIGLEKLKFNAIGMVHPNENGKEYEIGPMFSGERTPLLRFWSGPFSNNRQRYLTMINHTLARIIDGVAYTREPVLHYVIYLKMRDLVAEDVELSKEEREFYVAHTDDKGDHIMIGEDGIITGIIDWERAITTTKGEAFAGPSTFQEEDDALLVKEFEKRGRGDLALYVKNGRKYRQLNRCLDTDYERSHGWSRFRKLVGYMSGVWLAEFGTLRDWAAEAMVLYERNEGLIKVLLRVSNSSM